MAEPNIALPELRDGLEEVSPNRWKAFVIAHRQIGQSGCFLASLISAVFAPSGFDGLQGTGPYPLLA